MREAKSEQAAECGVQAPEPAGNFLLVALRLGRSEMFQMVLGCPDLSAHPRAFCVLTVSPPQMNTHTHTHTFTVTSVVIKPSVDTFPKRATEPKCTQQLCFDAWWSLCSYFNDLCVRDGSVPQIIFLLCVTPLFLLFCRLLPVLQRRPVHHAELSARLLRCQPTQVPDQDLYR